MRSSSFDFFTKIVLLAFLLAHPALPFQIKPSPILGIILPRGLTPTPLQLPTALHSWLPRRMHLVLGTVTAAAAADTEANRLHCTDIIAAKAVAADGGERIRGGGRCTPRVGRELR